MRISQEAYDTIRARLDASEERFSALQRYTIDWYGQPSTVVLETVCKAAFKALLRAEIAQADTEPA